MMNGKEKLYFLLDAIDNARDIAPSGQPLIIDPVNDLNNKYRDIELRQLFIKLENDKKILKVLQIPDVASASILEDHDPYDQPYAKNDGCWHIELLHAFDPFFLKVQQEPSYQEFTGKIPPVQHKQKLSRKSLEKIWTVLQEIEDKRGITPEGKDIPILQVHMTKVKDENEAKNYAVERLGILKILEEEDAIKDINFPQDHHLQGYVKTGNKYFEALGYYEKEYKKIAEEYQHRTQTPDNFYEITYTPSREVLLNKTFQLAKPDFDTENDLVFSHLYKNPNQKFTIQQIEKAIGRKLTKDLHKVVENLGFKSDLRKMFFSVSATSISFKNPITQEDLEALGIQKIKIS